jgi:uncharacterized protein YecE (DUF72 family)
VATERRIGCAGWSLPATLQPYFPDGASHLARYAQVFDAVEVNSSFYRPHLPRTWRKWAEAVPADFRFSVKLPKTISHEARLVGAEALLDDFLGQVGELGDQLGCLLLQLPPSLAFEAAAPAFLAMLRARWPGEVACEPRHRSWFTPAADKALREHAIARVAADPALVRRAAVPGGAHGFAYVRLHGSPHVYYDAYPRAVIDRLAMKLATRQQPCWVIFDNTAAGHAVPDALRLASGR